jgi:hypothetical protein
MNYYARVAELYTQLANVHWAMARNEMAANIQTLVEMPEAKIEATPVPEVAEPVKQETFNYPASVPDEEAVRKVAQNFAKKHGKDVAKAIIAKYGDNLASVDPADYHALMAEMAE